MQLWIDADACPTMIKDLVFRAVKRTGVKLTLVANTSIRVPKSDLIDVIVVGTGMNIADRKIVELVGPGDLVITADIPLAADVVAKGALALDPRGELYEDANVGRRVAMRNLFDGLRGEGHTVRGPSGFTPQDRQKFANELDRWLAKLPKPPKA